MATTATTPKTWATGDILTAADMNLYVRDNTSWLLTDKPICRVFNSANISVANNSLVALTFDSERFDNQNIHSTSSNTGRLTIPAGMAGKYLIGGHVQWAGNVTGDRLIRHRVNGATEIAEDERSPAAGGPVHPLITMYSLAAADYIELLAFQTSGGALNANFTANKSLEYWAVWIST